LSKTRDSDLLGFGKCKLHTLFFVGFRYNLSSILVRVYHSPDTDASVFQLEGGKEDSESAAAIIKPVFEGSVLNLLAFIRFIINETYEFF
jgi:hypothetical protein